MAKKKVQTKRKTGKPTATERLPDHLAGLPYEIARARAYVADADDRLRFIADSLEGAIHEFASDEPPERIRAAATQIWSNIVAGGFEGVGDEAQAVVRVGNVGPGPGDLVRQPGEVVGEPRGGRLARFPGAL